MADLKQNRFCNKGAGNENRDKKSSGYKRNYLFSNGITRFDTDTALTNKAAQHFYEKNVFVNEGITRSYYRDV